MKRSTVLGFVLAAVAAVAVIIGGTDSGSTAAPNVVSTHLAGSICDGC